MTVLGIDHINLSGSADLMERCRAFYCDVIGLTNGHRPAFRSRGFWLYAGEQPVVHLTVRDEKTDVGGATGFDHYAFQCQGLDATLERLTSHDVAFNVDRVPGSGRAQLFLIDPAGVSLELNFS
jgi:catechol 2,3-dioxygenase-like lactoylglutathione lyase family enzyme